MLILLIKCICICIGSGRPNGAGASKFPAIVHDQYNYRNHIAHQHSLAHHEILMMQSQSNGVGGVSSSNGTSSTMPPSSPFSSSTVWPYGSSSANAKGVGPASTLTGTPMTHHHHRLTPMHHHHHHHHNHNHHQQQQQQYHHPSSAATTMLLMNTNNNALNVINGVAGVMVAGNNRGKPRRGMMRRAVFSDAQRKGLERRFQVQKYISKPDRKRLADKLSLKDSQVIFKLLLYVIIPDTFSLKK